MRKLILTFLTGLLWFATNAQTQPPFSQRTNGTFTPVDPWLSAPRGFNVTNVLPVINTEPDYLIPIFPDLQGMSSGFPDQLYSMFNWVKANKTSKNIQALLTLGDLTDDANALQFSRVDTGFKKIDTLGIPYIGVIGNHDYDPGQVTPSRITTTFNTWFGINRYAGKPWAGNAFHNKTENFYIKFDVGSTKYLVVAMELFPTDTALQWASRVLDSFPDRKAIVLTHGYLTVWGERGTDTSMHSTITYGFPQDNSAQEMWDKMIKHHKNVFLVIGGHHLNVVTDDGNGYSSRFDDIGDSGNIVHQIFVNYQRAGNGSYTNPTGSNNVGLGYMMLMRVSPSRGKVYTSYYSPFLNQYDPLMDSFDLDQPGVEVKTTLGIQGEVLGRKGARFDNTVYLGYLPRNAFVITGTNSKLDTLPYQNPHKFLAGGIRNVDTSVYFRGIDTTDLPSDSGKYVLNKNGTLNNTQSANFMINQPSAIISSTVGGGMPSLSNGGLPAMLQIVQPGGNWGINICRPGNNAANAYLSFYKTRGLTANSKVALQGGDNIGAISWQGVCADGSTVEEAGRFLFGTDTVLASWPSGTIGIQFSSRGGALSGVQFKFTSRGWLGVNTATPATNLDVNGRAIIRDYFIANGNSTTWKPVVTDATGNIGLQSNPSPLVFTGTAAPATTPTNIGDMFVDTVNKKLYVATGTSSSSDWTILN